MVQPDCPMEKAHVVTSVNCSRTHSFWHQESQMHRSDSTTFCQGIPLSYTVSSRLEIWANIRNRIKDLFSCLQIVSIVIIEGKMGDGQMLREGVKINPAHPYKIFTEQPKKRKLNKVCGNH